MGFIARRYEEGDEIKIVDLLTKIFGKWPQFDLDCDPVAHWKWKYLENSSKKSTVTLVDDGGKIIGSHHRIYNRAKLGSKTQLIAQATDLGTHPEYRRMGVNTLLNQQNKDLEKYDQMKLTYWVTTNPIVIDSNKKGGSSPFVHNVNSLIKIRDIEKHFIARGNTDFVKKTGLQMINKINQVKQTFQQKNDDKNIRKINYFDEKIINFWEKSSSSYNFMMEATPEYLNWRYCDPRGGKYSIYIYEKNEKIQGYIVLRINRMDPNYSEGYIVELSALKNEHVINSLIAKVDQFFEENNVNLVNVLAVEKSKLEKSLKKNGWIVNPIHIVIFYGIKDLDEEDLTLFISSDPDQINFQYGTTDWI